MILPVDHYPVPPYLIVITLRTTISGTVANDCAVNKKVWYVLPYLFLQLHNKFNVAGYNSSVAVESFGSPPDQGQDRAPIHHFKAQSMAERMGFLDLMCCSLYEILIHTIINALTSSILVQGVKAGK